MGRSACIKDAKPEVGTASGKPASLVPLPPIPPHDNPPSYRDRRQREAQHEHHQRDLKPDQATDLTKDEFHEWTPWRRHGVARS